MNGFVQCLYFSFVCVCAGYLKDDRFMADVNLEQYYIIEENALSNADILLREDYFAADEEEDQKEHLRHAPNLTNFKSVVDETKLVHSLAGPDLDSFLANPVNFYHLIRRLDNGWREGLDILLQTKPCRQWNLRSISARLRYLKNSLPGERELIRIVKYIASLQTLYKLKAEDIADGKVGDVVSVKPLTLEEQFQIIQVLHDLEYTLISLEWLEQLYKRLMNLGVTQRDELPFAVIDVLNLMASENYQLNNFEKAKTFTEKILELDPDNALAKNNLIFFQQKLDSLKDSDDKVQNKKSSSRQLSASERLCARRSTKKLLRKYCKFLQYGFLFYKVEIIRKKPYIVIFHDVIRNETITGLKTFAHETLTDNAWVLGERYKAPTFNVEVKTEMLLRNRARRHVKRLIRYLDSLMLADDRKPILIDNLQLMNIGLEGTDIIRHRHELRLHSMFVDGKMTNVGGYFVFLNQVKTGGEVIFPQLGIKIHPTVGSVLFYEITKSTYHSFCPVVGSTLWVALRPVHESKDFCVDEDEWL